MKSLAVKQEFIQRRAEGQSYNAISSALKISKSTCSEWERDLEAEIAQRKQEELNALYEQYGMMKANRIKRLGRTLEKIDAALDAVDLSQVDPVKLLDYKLKYAAALKEEFTGATDALLPDAERATPANIFYTYNEIYARLRNGEITVAQAKIEFDAIAKIKGAFSTATEVDTMCDLFGHKDIDRKKSIEALITELEEAEED